MWSGFSKIALLAALPAVSLAAAEIDLGANSVLVYENEARRQQKSRMVVRLARFRPDIVLEWESVSDQGTLHLYSKAVADAREFTVGGLFEVGVDQESPDTMTLWVPQSTLRQLSKRGSAKLKRGAVAMELKVAGRKSQALQYNGESVEVPVLKVEDNRGGAWSILDDPENPLILRYQTRYFLQTLQSITTSETSTLRWIRSLPPVK